MADIQDLEKDIDEKIAELAERIEAGRKIISQCKQQLNVLRSKQKEYKRIKEQVRLLEVSEGDL